ncbi:hypothetical protein PoMZ_05277 [Pyricularia oryzae]|uniref:Protein kinase domain-containing protein n=1 Tax=Pyricularia oryzae TaxID=318829 RepID=A0A4P7NMW5_PYROR|nr:hypothetical protein PoMZ_05277 [Pyricularia oryzae]
MEGGSVAPESEVLSFGETEREAIGKELKEAMRPAIKRCAMNSQFICASDMNRIWSKNDRLKGLSSQTKRDLGQNSIPFLSLAVHIGQPLKWFLEDFPKLPAESSTKLPIETNLLERLLESDHRRINTELKPCDEQSKFVPKALRLSEDEVLEQKVESGHSLPLETNEDFTGTQGSFGNVYFCHIPPEYVEMSLHAHSQVFKPVKPLAVAVKVIKQQRENEDQDAIANAGQEAENLRFLKRVVGNRACSISLASVILSHEDLEVPLFIFPFANLGNLRQFLDGGPAVVDEENRFKQQHFEKRFPEFPHTWSSRSDETSKQQVGYPDRSKALLEQCRGLAEALRLLHEETKKADDGFLFAHLDLKPDNILIFACPLNPVGIWKLADFGISGILTQKLTRLKKENFVEILLKKNNATVQEINKRLPSTHQAPEIELAGPKPQNEIRIGRSSDIWSFAAISAEVLAFAVGGSDSVEQFANERKIPHRGTQSDQFWEHSNNSSRQTNEQSHPQSTPSVYISSEQNSALDSQFRDAFKVSEKVTSFLKRIETYYPLSEPWVRFIIEGLQVVPKERPSAHNMYLSVHEALHPGKLPSRPPVTASQDKRLSGSSTPRKASTTKSGDGTPIYSPVTHRTTDSRTSLASNLTHDQIWFDTKNWGIKSPSGEQLLGKDVKSVCFAESRIIYLTGQDVFVWNIIPPTGPETELDQFRLPKPSPKREATWVGVAGGGNYIVLYGYEQEKGLFSHKSKEPKMHTLLLEQSSPIRSTWKSRTTITGSDPIKKVAVSCHNHVARLQGESLLVFDANNPEQSEIKLRGKPEKMSIYDLAFSKHGDYLYVSGTAVDCIVLVYSVELEGSCLNRIKHVATPKYKLNDQAGSGFDDLLVLPQSFSQGCLIGTLRLQSLFIWQMGKNQDGELYRLRHENSGKVIAAATHGSRVLLLIQKKGLFQYDIDRRTPGRPQLYNESTLGSPKFKREPTRDAILRIYSLSSCVLVAIFHANGEAEVFEFLPAQRALN